MPILALCLLIACGGNTAPASGSNATVEDTAMRFARAALAGDRTTALALSLTSDELAAISNKATKGDLDREVKDFLDHLQHELGTAQVTRVEVVKRRTLTPGVDEKVKREIEVVMVKVHIKDNDGNEHASPFPWLFLKTDDGWKFSPKQ